MDDSRRLLGRPHHLSIHPGGVVITPGPIEEAVPLQRAPKGVVITQLDKDGVEAIGLVKFDLLGNRALATVDEAGAWLARTCRETNGAARPAAPGTQYCSPALALGTGAHRVPLPADDDPSILALLQRGDTLGVNQLESPAMRHLLIQMRPRGLDDVVQVTGADPARGGVYRRERVVRPPPAWPGAGVRAAPMPGAGAP